MKRIQLVKNLFCEFGLAVLIVISLSATAVQGQDYKKVISVLEKMETSLKTELAKEQKARETEIAELREQIHQLQQTIIPGGIKAKAETEFPHADLLNTLKKGNERYVTGSLAKKEFNKERTETINSQHPYAIVLTCSDSRVPPELIFDESLGKLFVVRDAGNIVDSVILGSIEYAAEHLHVKLLLVLGHESCGAVKATIEGGKVPDNIGSLVKRLKSPVKNTIAKNLKGEALVSACVEENVRYQMQQSISQSHVLAELVEKGELALVGGIYDLDSGRVKFLENQDNEQHKTKKEASHGH